MKHGTGLFLFAQKQRVLEGQWVKDQSCCGQLRGTSEDDFTLPEVNNQLKFYGGFHFIS
jgi:hypothetical protein